MIVIAAFKSPAVIAGLDDVTVMGQPVEQRGGHLGVAEHAGPFSEGEIARAYMLADNKLTDRSTWDDTKVAIQLKELSDLALDFDIEAIGFELPEIQAEDQRGFVGTARETGARRAL